MAVCLFGCGVCSQAEASAKSRSLVQGSYTECVCVSPWVWSGAAVSLYTCSERVEEVILRKEERRILISKHFDREPTKDTHGYIEPSCWEYDAYYVTNWAKLDCTWQCKQLSSFLTDSCCHYALTTLVLTHWQLLSLRTNNCCDYALTAVVLTHWQLSLRTANCCHYALTTVVVTHWQLLSLHTDNCCRYALTTVVITHWQLL
jgi:hypothetical protein